MSDLPDHCNSSAPGVSGAGRSGQVITPLGYIIASVPANSYYDFDFVTTLENADFSFIRFAIEHDGIGPQTARIYIDIDGLPSYVCVAAYDFESTIVREFGLVGGWHASRVFGYRFRVYNTNYIDRAASLTGAVSETPL
jgi:hypothetical protein